MTREELLKNYILTQYKSVREFCVANNFPYSTVDSAFKRGILKSSVSLVVQICDRLDIELESLIDNKIKLKEAPLGTLTLRERAIIHAYRANPSMHGAVDKLLGLPDDGPTVGEDIASTVAAAVEKSFVKN